MSKNDNLQRIATFVSLKMKMFRRIRQIGRWTNLKFANAGTNFKGRQLARQKHKNKVSKSKNDNLQCSGVNKGGYWGYLPPLESWG